MKNLEKEDEEKFVTMNVHNEQVDSLKNELNNLRVHGKEDIETLIERVQTLEVERQTLVMNNSQLKSELLQVHIEFERVLGVHHKWQENALMLQKKLAAAHETAESHKGNVRLWSPCSPDFIALSIIFDKGTGMN